jgi:plastocyanin
MHNSLRKNEKKNHRCLVKLRVFRGISIARSSVMNMKIKFGHEFFAGVFFIALFASASFAYEEIVVKDGGTIRGSVKIDGKVPKLPPLQITKYKEVCKDVPNESLLVGPGQGVRYAVVTLEGITKGKAVEKEAAHEMDNLGCRFVPHVLASSVGQFVVFKNSDPILHTAHALFTGGQPEFNIGLYPGKVSRKPLVTPGVVKIICEVHPWMSAYIVVTDHPYYSVTDIYGEYLINDIPAGSYRLKVWHETLGTQEKPVEVKAGASQNVDFVLSPKPGVKK